MWSQRDVTFSHFLVKSILRFSPLLLLLCFWEKHKRIKRKMLYRKRFWRSEKIKRIKRKTQNTKNLMSFWRKYDKDSRDLLYLKINSNPCSTNKRTTMNLFQYIQLGCLEVFIPHPSLKRMMLVQIKRERDYTICKTKE